MNSEVMQTPQLSIGRLLLLGVSSVILCMSQIMTVFAPFPLALAIILYGRSKGYAVAFAGLMASLMLSIYLFKLPLLLGFYCLVMIFGIGIAEIVKKGISPIKGLVVLGLSVISIVFISIGLFFNTMKIDPKQFIVQQIQNSADEIAAKKVELEQSTNKEAIQVLQILDKPELIANEVIDSFPTYFFIGVFLMLWFNMFLVLKSRRLLLSGHDYPYSESSLLNFKVPFPYVGLLIVGLALAVFGEDLFKNEMYESIGYKIIMGLGIFYFFQGLGVFSDLMTFLGMGGLFRTVIVILVIFMANYLIAVAGLFDNWFDFRKYFVKRNTEE